MSRLQGFTGFGNGSTVGIHSQNPGDGYTTWRSGVVQTKVELFQLGTDVFDVSAGTATGGLHCIISVYHYVSHVVVSIYNHNVLTAVATGNQSGREAVGTAHGAQAVSVVFGPVGHCQHFFTIPW